MHVFFQLPDSERRILSPRIWSVLVEAALKDVQNLGEGADATRRVRKTQHSTYQLVMRSIMTTEYNSAGHGKAVRSTSFGKIL